ncbi:MAG: hypothetical protein LBT56_02915 [Prevotellaceae bacterium]|jgi:type IV secretory pathway TrbD component|nr:hypothetical protein [Prevotellaceae bacterium]
MKTIFKNIREFILFIAVIIAIISFIVALIAMFFHNVILAAHGLAIWAVALFVAAIFSKKTPPSGPGIDGYMGFGYPV